MREAIREQVTTWLTFLEQSEYAFGIPLILVGLAFMFMGWNFYRVAVPMIFILIGLLIGHTVFAETSTQWLLGGLIGVVLALGGFLVLRYSISILAGLCMAFILSGYLSTFKNLGMPQVGEWGVAAFGFIAGAALAFIMFREMVIIITSFVGSLFLISGMNAILPHAVPTFYMTVSDFLRDYPALIIPFLVGGPTLIGTLVQLANANRGDAGAS